TIGIGPKGWPGGPEGSARGAMAEKAHEGWPLRPPPCPSRGQPLAFWARRARITRYGPPYWFPIVTRPLSRETPSPPMPVFRGFLPDGRSGNQFKELRAGTHNDW